MMDVRVQRNMKSVQIKNPSQTKYISAYNKKVISALFPHKCFVLCIPISSHRIEEKTTHCFFGLSWCFANLSLLVLFFSSSKNLLLFLPFSIFRVFFFILSDDSKQPNVTSAAAAAAIQAAILLYE